MKKIYLVIIMLFSLIAIGFSSTDVSAFSIYEDYDDLTVELVTAIDFPSSKYITVSITNFGEKEYTFGNDENPAILIASTKNGTVTQEIPYEVLDRGSYKFYYHVDLDSEITEMSIKNLFIKDETNQTLNYVQVNTGPHRLISWLGIVMLSVVLIVLFTGIFEMFLGTFTKKTRTLSGKVCLIVSGVLILFTIVIFFIVPAASSTVTFTTGLARTWWLLPLEVYLILIGILFIKQPIATPGTIKDSKHYKELEQEIREEICEEIFDEKEDIKACKVKKVEVKKSETKKDLSK